MAFLIDGHKLHAGTGLKVFDEVAHLASVIEGGVLGILAEQRVDGVGLRNKYLAGSAVVKGAQSKGKGKLDEKKDENDDAQAACQPAIGDAL
jgi:hypothetical protein